jgi:hypothetical protein
MLNKTDYSTNNINNALSQIPEENLIPMMTMSEKKC